MIILLVRSSRWTDRADVSFFFLLLLCTVIFRVWCSTCKQLRRVVRVYNVQTSIRRLNQSAKHLAADGRIACGCVFCAGGRHVTCDCHVTCCRRRCIACTCSCVRRVCGAIASRRCHSGRALVCSARHRQHTGTEASSSETRPAAPWRNGNKLINKSIQFVII